MQVASSSQIDKRPPSEGAIAGQKLGEFEGNAQTVIHSLKLNTINQIRKNSNRIYNKSKHRQPSCEMDEFVVEQINSKIICQKQSNEQEQNGEQATEKTKITLATGGPDESRQASFSQNHNHSNTLNENSLQKFLFRVESQSENNNQQQLICFQNNTPCLNNTQSHLNTVATQNQVGQLGIAGNSEVNLEYDNNNLIPNKMNSNISIPGVETCNEFDKKMPFNKNAKSNQTLTTLTTQGNTQYSGAPHLIPSLSIVSRCGSNILTSKQRSKASSFQSKTPSIIQNTGVLTDNLIEQASDRNMYIKSNNITSNNFFDTNKSSLNLIHSDRDHDKLDQSPEISESHKQQQQQSISQSEQSLSDSSSNNFQQLMNSPLPIKKLPIEYLQINNASKNNILNQLRKWGKNNDFNKNQTDKIPQQQNQNYNDQSNNTIKINNNINITNDNLDYTTNNLNTNLNTTILNNNLNITNNNLNQTTNSLNQTTNRLNIEGELDRYNQNQYKNKQLNINKEVKTISDIDIKTARSQLNLDLNIINEDNMYSQNKNMQNFNQQSTQNPKSGPSTNPSVRAKMDIEQMDQMLKAGQNARAKAKTNDTEQRNRYLTSFCKNPSIEGTKHDIDQNQNYYDKMQSKNKKNNNLNQLNDEELQLKCNDVLEQISSIGLNNDQMEQKSFGQSNELNNQQNNVSEVQKILQGFLQQEKFMKLLIQQAQKSIYNEEVKVTAKFKFKSDQYLKDVIIQEIKNLDSNQMLAFADRQIIQSTFFRIVQYIYMIFHQIFLKIIIFLFISALFIFSIYFTNDSISLINWILIFSTFLCKCVLSLLYNYNSVIQNSKYSQYYFFLFCGCQICYIFALLLYNTGNGEENIITIILKSVQIINSLILAILFYRMNKATQLFQSCFKIQQV